MHLQKRKEHKSANDSFIAVLLLFYDIKYINSTKKRFSNKKFTMMPQVSLIPNLKMNIVTKFQALIFKNDKAFVQSFDKEKYIQEHFFFKHRNDLM